MQISGSLVLWLVSFAFSKKNTPILRKSCLPVFHTSCDIFIQNFVLHAVTFSHVLHLDVIRSQIELMKFPIILDNPLP